MLTSLERKSMRYKKVIEAKFISRPNRFVAQVDVKGLVETVHVKNTGRCRELLLPDVPVILAEADNPARKTRYDLIAVEKAGLGLVNIDSQAPIRLWENGCLEEIMMWSSRSTSLATPA